MSPVHNLRPFSTHTATLAQLLQVSSPAFALVSIHIPEAHEAHYCKSFLSCSSCDYSAVASFLLIHPFSLSVSALVRVKGMTYKLVEWVMNSLSFCRRRNKVQRHTRTGQGQLDWSVPPSYSVSNSLHPLFVQLNCSSTMIQCNVIYEFRCFLSVAALPSFERHLLYFWLSIVFNKLLLPLKDFFPLF